jgi:integrase
MNKSANKRGKNKRSREAIYVIPYMNAGGSQAWRVSGMFGRKQVRANYKTEAEALAHKDDLLGKLAGIASSVVRRPTRLTEEQLKIAELCFELMGARSPLVAVRYFLDNYKEPVNKITVEDAYTKFIAGKKLNNLRRDSIRNLEVRVGSLKKDHGAKLVSDVLADHLKDIVFKTDRSAVSNDNARRALSSFFTWAAEHKYCDGNPMLAIKPVKTERDEPETLTIAQARNLIAQAAAYKAGVILPYIALGLFAGIRPTEMARITWDNIDLTAGTITIGAKIAKMRQRRIVDMACVTQKDDAGKETVLPANLLAWLMPFALKKPPMRGKNWRRDFDAVKLAAGFGNKDDKPKGEETEDARKKREKLIPWTQDIMRHTAISNHLAYFQHEGKTAAWAGNSPDIIQRHYKGLVKQAEAVEFWGIVPDANKVVSSGIGAPAAVAAA